jgi:hypothetical protein
MEKIENENSDSPLEFSDGFESDLMGDDEDRQQLEAMNEKERETELFKRAERRDMLKHQWEVMKKMKLSKMTANNNADVKVRSFERKKNVGVNKTDEKRSSAMAQLKAERENKQQKKEALEETGTEVVFYCQDDDNSKNEDREPTSYCPPKPTVFLEPVPACITKLEELQRLQVPRHIFEEIIDLPTFDKLVIGWFVRVNIGRPGMKHTNQIAEIIGVVESSKTYFFGEKHTRKAFKLQMGVIEEVVRLQFISNK